MKAGSLLPIEYDAAGDCSKQKYAEAEHVYREDMKQHPHNGWSLLALMCPFY